MTREEIKQLPIRRNEAEDRFEFMIPEIEGMGRVEYEKRGDKFFLMHTEIPDALKGTGAAGIMVTKVMEYLKANNFKMAPFCPYIKTYLKRHPEWEFLKGS